MTTPTNGSTTAAALSTPTSTIVQFNPASQLPIKLTGSLNFSTWKAQVSMLMYGHDLFGHLDDTTPKPSPTTGTDSAPNPAYSLWFRQDKLIQNALMASVDPTIAPLIANADSSHNAWQSLHATYANKSHSRLFSLRDQLARLSKNTQFLTDYLTRVRALADELAQAGSPITNDELVVYILRGLGPEYREISAAIRARDTSISYEELYDKLHDHDLFLHHEIDKKQPPPITAAAVTTNSQPSLHHGRPPRRDSAHSPHTRGTYRGNNRIPRRDSRPPPRYNADVTCQLCRRVGHEANVCRSRSHNHLEAKANHVAVNPTTAEPWILDTGATHHISSEPHDMAQYVGYEGILMGNGMKIPITHSGSTQLLASNSVFRLSNTLCAPQIKRNLISVSKFCQDNNTSVEFFPSHFCVKDLQTRKPLVQGRSTEGLYEWPKTVPTAAIAEKPSSSVLWHHRLGYPHTKIFNFICKNNALSSPIMNNSSTCNSCLCNKSHRLPFRDFTLTSTKPLQTIFSDLWGPSPLLSIDKKLYYCVFVDQFTKYTWIYTLKTKTEVKPIIESLFPVLEKHFDAKILSLYTDGGTEYKSIDTFLLSNGIEHLVSPPYTPQRVATAERRHRHILETAKTLLTESSLPPIFWSFACHHAVYLINRMPTPNLNYQSPYEKMFKKKPNYESLKCFGCLCYPWIRPYTNHKLDPRSTPCVYLGLSLAHHCHLCFDPVKSKLYLSRDVVFVEHDFPYKTKFNNLNSGPKLVEWDASENRPCQPTQTDCPSHACDLPQPIIVPAHTRHVLDTPSAPSADSLTTGMSLPAQHSLHSHTPDCSIHHPRHPSSQNLDLADHTQQPPNPPLTRHSQSPTPDASHSPNHAHPINPTRQPTSPINALTEQTHPAPETFNLPPVPIPPDSQLSTAQSPTTEPHPIPPTQPTRRPVTRSQNQIYKPKSKSSFLTTTDPTTVPHTVTQAKKHKVWRDAMQLEFDALMSNRTWELVPHDPSKNIVACRWLFRIKRKPDGSIDRYKVRLVAKGFTQRPGIDYHSTFSPVVKPTTVRIVLSIVVSRNWPLRQLDVNNAFLQGDLTEEVYMSQPPGYESSQYPSHVCRLQKAIYGLKQAPLAWYTALTTHLQSIGFLKSKSDPSLFILLTDRVVVYILVYVDDIIVTGSHAHVIDRVINSLATRFSIKDLGPLQYFLGIEVIRSDKGLVLSQHGYIDDLLSSESMHESNPVATPMSTTTVLTLHDGAARFDSSRYRTVLGKLQYLSFTRPDISYSVNKLSQFMHDPSVIHWAALKRILRYLRGTSTLGLVLHNSNDYTLSMFSDADWAGDVDGRNSTSGHILFLGKNPISWSSKKQQTVARSSTEAEYKAVANAASEVCWVQNLLNELNIHASAKPIVYCDNAGVHYLSNNPTVNTRMKHVAVDFHFVRNLIQLGKLRIQHIHAAHQLADTLTKPLSKSLFHSNLSKLGVVSNYKLEGGV